ncbi:MAG TPA: hypothetical protein VFJ97_17245, partial [Dermatophilaceae bacterium]|nr:hypothetical protein [Dermatophilaceae bacterium]
DLLHLTPGPGDATSGDVRPVVRRVLGIGYVAARTAMAQLPIQHTDRPRAVAAYTLDHLDTWPDDTPGLRLWSPGSLAPTAAPATPTEHLEAAVAAWLYAATAELRRPVPSSDTIRNIPAQTLHLHAATAAIHGTPPATTDAATALVAAGRHWQRATTLTRPAHAYLVAAANLYDALNQTIQTAAHLADTGPLPDQHRIERVLDHGMRGAQRLLDQSVVVATRLHHGQALFVNARQVAPAIDRLDARIKGRLVPLVRDETRLVVEVTIRAAHVNRLALQTGPHTPATLPPQRDWGVIQDRDRALTRR